MVHSAYYVKCIYDTISCMLLGSMQYAYSRSTFDDDDWMEGPTNLASSIIVNRAMDCGLWIVNCDDKVHCLMKYGVKDHIGSPRWLVVVCQENPLPKSPPKKKDRTEMAGSYIYWCCCFDAIKEDSWGGRLTGGLKISTELTKQRQCLATTCIVFGEDILCVMFPTLKTF